MWWRRRTTRAAPAPRTTTPTTRRSAKAGQPTYVALVSLDSTSIRTEDGVTPLEPGMAVTTEIKTGRRTVISDLLSPLLRFKQEGLRER